MRSVLAGAFQQEAGSVANVGTRMAVDFTSGAAGATADQVIRPGDQDGSGIVGKGGQRVLSGRIGAVLGRADQRAFSGGGRRAATDPDGKPIDLPGLDGGSGKPIGSVADALF